MEFLGFFYCFFNMLLWPDPRFTDAILAATAEAEDAELKTINKKHYPMLKGLRPAYTKWKANKPVEQTACR
jgi:hypothetical protein